MPPDTKPGTALGRESAALPYVSIVMPHYQVPGPWAEAAVRSAVEQVYPRERLEVIVVDDHSGDTSHLRRIEGIRLVELGKNGGPSIARNTGVSVAEGEYVFFADADDHINPEAVISCARSAPGYALTYTDHQKVTADLSDVIHERKKARFHELHHEHKGTLLDPLLHTSFIGMCQFVNTEAFHAIGGYDSSLRKGEDFDMLLRLSELERAVNFTHVPRTLYDYRQNLSSISHDTSLHEQPYEAIRRALARRGFIGTYPTGSMRLKPYDNTFFDIARNGRIVDVPYIERENKQLRGTSEPLKNPDAYHPLWTMV